jgi:hypothetical protein
MLAGMHARWLERATTNGHRTHCIEFCTPACLQACTPGGWRGLLQMAIVHTVLNFAHPHACRQALQGGQRGRPSYARRPHSWGLDCHRQRQSECGPDFLYLPFARVWSGKHGQHNSVQALFLFPNCRVGQDPIYGVYTVILAGKPPANQQKRLLLLGFEPESGGVQFEIRFCTLLLYGNTPYIAVNTPFKYVYTEIRNLDTAGGGWKIRRIYRTL